MQKCGFDSLAFGYVRSQCDLLVSGYHIPHTFTERQAGGENSEIQCEVLQKHHHQYDGIIPFATDVTSRKPTLSARNRTIMDLRKNEGEGAAFFGGRCAAASSSAPLLTRPRWRMDDIELSSENAT